MLPPRNSAPRPDGSIIARSAVKDRRGHIEPDTLTPSPPSQRRGDRNSSGFRPQPRRLVRTAVQFARTYFAVCKKLTKPRPWRSSHTPRGPVPRGDVVVLRSRAAACAQGRQLESDRAARTRAEASASPDRTGCRRRRPRGRLYRADPAAENTLGQPQRLRLRQSVVRAIPRCAAASSKVAD